jgi:proteasome lid subunit RPN8/RPN11
MADQGQSTYPEECCGLLIGTLAPGDGSRTVQQIQPLQNQWVPAVQTVTDPDGDSRGARRQRQPSPSVLD